MADLSLVRGTNSSRLVRLFVTSLVGIALIAIAVVYLQPGLSRWLNIYDEGLMAYGAVRVMDGQAPYRDFWGMYSPGQFYVLALLLKLFGPSIMVERLWDVAVRAVLACVIFFLAARLSSWKAALPVWLVSLIWLEYFGFFGYPIFTGLLFVMLSCWGMAHRGTASGGTASSLWGLVRAQVAVPLLVAGGFAGVAAWFRHDLAMYVVAAELLVLFGYGMAESSGEGTLVRRVGAAMRGLVPYLVALVVAVAPVALLLLATAPLGELVNQLLVFPLTVFPRMRDLPYPPPALANLPYYLPFVVYAVTAVLAVLAVRHARKEQTPDRAALGARAWAAGAVILFGLFGFNQANIRSDLIHIPQFFLPAIVLMAPLMAGFKPVLKEYNYAVAAPTAAVLLLLAIPAVGAYVENYPKQPPARHSIARAQGVPVDTNQLRAIQFIQQSTTPTETIYSAVARHDKIFINDVMFYFLAERHSATRYHELHPGQATTLPVQQEIAADLERNSTRYIVVVDMFGEVCEPNASCQSSGVTYLDDYIRQHYGTLAQYGPYRVLMRRR